MLRRSGVTELLLAFYGPQKFFLMQLLYMSDPFYLEKIFYQSRLLTVFLCLVGHTTLPSIDKFFLLALHSYYQVFFLTVKKENF